jgi:hypothetical protein
LAALPLFFRAALLVALLLPASALGSEIVKERFAKGTDTASESYQATGGTRIGLLLVCTDRTPDPGFRYAGRHLLSEKRDLKGDPHRMARQYELRLYEVLREAFERAGFQVYSLNRKSWRGVELKDVMKRSDQDGLVCAAHYAIRRTHRIFEKGDHAWWTPFEGMPLSLKLTVFDADTGDRVHELEVRSLGTEALFEARSDLVVEEPLHASGYDRHGSPNAYKIAIYNTGVKELKKARHPIPIIRTAKGSLDIADDAGESAYRDRVLDVDEMRRMNIDIPEQAAWQSTVMSRLLEHVPYRPLPADVEYYDLQSVERCGRLVAGRIPPRPGS